MIAVDDLRASFLPVLQADRLVDLADEQLVAILVAARAGMSRFQQIIDGVTLEQLRRGAARPEADMLLTADAVALRLGVSTSWVRRASRGRGTLARVVRIVGSNTRRYSSTELDKWIAKQRGDAS